MPRKAGNLRLQKAFTYIEKYEDDRQDSFSQLCNEHLISKYKDDRQDSFSQLCNEHLISKLDEEVCLLGGGHIKVQIKVQNVPEMYFLLSVRIVSLASLCTNSNELIMTQ